MRRAGVGVERDPSGVWTIAPDHLERVAAHETAMLRDRPVAVEALSAQPHERLVDADVRLVIDAKGERVWLDRVLLTHLGQSGFAMILALAKRGGDLVPSRDVEKAMSPKRPSEGAAKAAAKKIPAWVRALRSRWEARARR